MIRFNTCDFFLNHEWKIKRRNLTIKDCIYSKPLESLRFFLLHLFLVYVCTSVCVPRGIHAGDQRSMSRVLYSFLPYFLKQFLSLSLESTDWVDLLPGKLQGSPPPPSPRVCLHIVFCIGAKDPNSGLHACEETLY